MIEKLVRVFNVEFLIKEGLGHVAEKYGISSITCKDNFDDGVVLIVVCERPKELAEDLDRILAYRE